MPGRIWSRVSSSEWENEGPFKNDCQEKLLWEVLTEIAIQGYERESYYKLWERRKKNMGEKNMRTSNYRNIKRAELAWYVPKS